MTNAPFIFIESRSSDVATLDKEFEQNAVENGIICTSCDTIKPDAFINSVKVQGVLNDAPFGMIVWGLGIARKDFLYSLGEEVVHRDLNIGTVENMKGRQLGNWVMFSPKHRILVRRSQDHARLRRCDTCGNVFYFAVGSPYLVKPLPRADVDIFYSNGLALVVREGLTEKIRETKWKKVRFTPLEILEEPRDGLGCIAM